MELKRRFDFRLVFVIATWLIFAVYLVFGLQPAGAAHYDIDASLIIPSINLSADVTELSLNNHKLDTPDTIVGSYSETENKTLLIGHSTTVFENLKNTKLKEEIYYAGRRYKVSMIQVLPKKKISMKKIMADSKKNTIILMTCAGTLLEGGDATHRLIVTARAVD